MTERPTEAIMLTGTNEPPATSRAVRAGGLSAIFEDGALRRIAYGGREAIRGIAFVVRDENWGTYGPEITDLAVDEAGEAFRITYRARCADDRQSLSYAVTIEGRADGSLAFAAEGAATGGAFTTNRTGFCVLHPIAGVAGAPVTVLHVDGSEEEATFPDTIKPSQPFFDIRAITHEVAPGLSVTCAMEGDAYEMEDQRNWTDASFKTYIRPLSRPRPYQLAGDEAFSQSVTLAFSGSAPAAAQANGPITLTVDASRAAGTLPEIDLAIDPALADAALSAAEEIAGLGPTSLWCTFDRGAGHGPDDMAVFRTLAERTGTRIVLEAVLALKDADGTFTADPAVLAGDVAAVKDAAEEGGLNPAAVSVSPACYLKSYQPVGPWPDAPPLEDVYAAVRRAFPDAALYGGMHASFTELNRKWPPLRPLDAITHTTTAIVHAADDLSVMETLEALPAVFASVCVHAGEKPYRIGPSAIGMRFNPYGAGTVENPDNRRIAMAKVDPRQRGLFNAAWTLGYIAAAARAGVSSVCLSAPVGPFGVLWRPMDWPQLFFDDARERGPFLPVYHVLAGLCATIGATVRPVHNPQPDKVAAVAVDDPAGAALWIANLTNEAADVMVDGLGPSVDLCRLGTGTFGDCCRSHDGFQRTRSRLAAPSVRLGPYEVVRLSPRRT